MKNQTVSVNLAFTADTKQATQQLKSLRQQLDSLHKGTNLKANGFTQLTPEIQKAAQAAGDLQVKLNQAINTNTGKLNLTQFNNSLKSSGKTLGDYARELNKLGPQGRQAFQNLAQSIMKAEEPLLKADNALKKFGQTMANTVKWQISSSLIHGLVGSYQKALGYAKDLNASLNDIMIVTGNSSEQMARFAKSANIAAKNLSTTTTEYTKASLIYFQQGLSDAEVKKRTDTTIKMANVTKQSVDEVSNQMTAVWNNFAKHGEDLERFADVMTALGAATASSSDEIAGGLEKFAALADTIGLSFDYAASALATITAETRQSEEVVGTALKTIFARIQGLKLGETLDDGTSLNKYSQALKTVGIDIFNQAGELKNMDTILDEMGSKWETLSKAQQMALAQTVAGTRQYTQLVALMDNWDQMEMNLNISATADGTLEQQAEIYEKSWEAASKRTKAAIEGLWDSILNDDFFIKLTDGLGKFVGVLENFIDGMGGLKGVLVYVGTLATRVFKDQIAGGLTRAATTLKSFTKTGQQERQQLRQDAIDSLANLKSTSGGMKGQAETKQLQGQHKMQQDLLNASKRLTQENIAQAQNEIDRINRMAEQLVSLGEIVDAEKKRTDELKKQSELMAKAKGQQRVRTNSDFLASQGEKAIREAINAKDPTARERKILNAATQAEKTIMDKYGLTSKGQVAADPELEKEMFVETTKALAQLDDALGESIRKAIAEAEENAGKREQQKQQERNKNIEQAAVTTERGYNLDQSVGALKQQISSNSSSEQIANVQEQLKTKIQETKKEANELKKHLDDAGKVKMQGIVGDLSKLEQELEDGKMDAQKLKDILDRMSKGQSFEDNIAEISQSGLGIDADGAENELFEQKRRETRQTLNYQGYEDTINKEQQKFGQHLIAQGGAIDGWADQITSASSAIMSLGSVITSVQGLINVFNNPDATAWEKLIAIIGAATPILTTFGTILKSVAAAEIALGEAETAEAVTSGVNAAANIAQAEAADEVAEAKMREKAGNEGAMGSDVKETATSVANAAANKAQDVSGKGGKLSKIGGALKSKGAGLKEVGKNWLSKNGAMLGKLGLLTAGIAVAAITYKTIDALYNKAENDSKKAAQAAIEAQKAYQSVSQAHEEFINTISSYEEAKNGLDGLVQGTQEYEEALLKANEQAMALLDTNENLTYTIGPNGEIIIDHDSLEAAQEESLQRKKDAQFASLRANIEADEAKNKADATDFARKEMGGWGTENFNSIGGGALGGAAAGALIGSAIPVIGTAIGAIGGAIVGAITGMVKSWDGSSEASEQEAIQQMAEYYRENQGRGFENADRIREIANSLGGAAKLYADELAANASATRELVAQMAKTEIANENLTKAIVQDTFGEQIEDEFGSNEKAADAATKLMSEEYEKKLAENQDKWEDKGKLGGGITDEEAQKKYAEIMGWNVNHIDNLGGNKATYYDNQGNIVADSISDETARQAIAEWETKQWLKEQDLLTGNMSALAQHLGAASSMYEGLDLTSFIGGEGGNFGSLTQDQAQEIYDKVKSGYTFGLNSEDVRAMGYSSLKDFQNALMEGAEQAMKSFTEDNIVSIYGEESGKLINDAFKFSNDGDDKGTDLTGFDQNTQKNVQDAMANAFEGGGEEATGIVKNIVDGIVSDTTLSDEAKKEALDALGNLDMTNLSSFDDLEYTFSSLGIAIDNSLIPALAEATEAVYNFNPSNLIAGAKTLRDLSVGDSISEAQYQQLISSGAMTQETSKEFVVANGDGTYTVVGDVDQLRANQQNAAKTTFQETTAGAKENYDTAHDNWVRDHGFGVSRMNYYNAYSMEEAADQVNYTDFTGKKVNNNFWSAVNASTFGEEGAMYDPNSYMGTFSAGAYSLNADGYRLLTDEKATRVLNRANDFNNFMMNLNQDYSLAAPGNETYDSIFNIAYGAGQLPQIMAMWESGNTLGAAMMINNLAREQGLPGLNIDAFYQNEVDSAEIDANAAAPEIDKAEVGAEYYNAMYQSGMSIDEITNEFMNASDYTDGEGFLDFLSTVAPESELAREGLSELREEMELTGTINKNGQAWKKFAAGMQDQKIIDNAKELRETLEKMKKFDINNISDGDLKEFSELLDTIKNQLSDIYGLDLSPEQIKANWEDVIKLMEGGEGSGQAYDNIMFNTGQAQQEISAAFDIDTSGIKTAEDAVNALKGIDGQTITFTINGNTTSLEDTDERLQQFKGTAVEAALAMSSLAEQGILVNVEGLSEFHAALAAYMDAVDTFGPDHEMTKQAADALELAASNMAKSIGSGDFTSTKSNLGGGGGGGGDDRNSIAEKRKSALEKERSDLQKKREGKYASAAAEYYDKEIKLLKEENAILEEQLALKKDILKNAITEFQQKYPEFDIQLNDDGTIAGLSKMLAQLEAEALKVEAEGGDASAIYEKMEAMEEMLKANEDIANSLEEIDDNTQAMAEATLNKITEQIDEQVDAIDKKIDIANYYQEKLLNLAWGNKQEIEAMLEGFQYQVEEMNLLFEKSNVLIDGIEQLDRASKSFPDQAKMFNDAIEGYQEDLMDATEAMIDLRVEIEELIGSVLELAQAEIDIQLGRIDTYVSMLDSYNNIIDLSGRSTIDFANKTRIGAMKVDFYASKMKIMTQEMNSLRTATEQAKQILEERIDAGDEQSVKFWEYQVEELKKKSEEASAEFLGSWEEVLNAASELYEARVEMAISVMEDAISPYKTMDEFQAVYDRAKEIQERYLSDSKKLYELNKLNRQLNLAIADENDLLAKSKLRDLQQDILELQRGGVQMNQHDLDIMQKKYDLRLAEIALMEAQNSKTRMRLVRDASGNYSYVYDADEQKIEDATQQYEDAVYALQELAEQYVTEVSDQLLENQTAYQEAIMNLDKTATDYDEQLLDTTQYYVERQRYLLEELDKAAKESGINFADTLYASQLGVLDYVDAYYTFEEASDNMIDELTDSHKEFSTMINETMDLAGTSWEDFGTDTDAALTTLEDHVAKLCDEIENLVNVLMTYVNQSIAMVTAWQREYSETWSQQIAQNEAIFEKDYSKDDKTAQLNKAKQDTANKVSSNYIPGSNATGSDEYVWVEGRGWVHIRNSGGGYGSGSPTYTGVTPIGNTGQVSKTFYDENGEPWSYVLDKNNPNNSHYVYLGEDPALRKQYPYKPPIQQQPQSPTQQATNSQTNNTNKEYDTTIDISDKIVSQKDLNNAYTARNNQCAFFTNSCQNAVGNNVGGNAWDMDDWYAGRGDTYRLYSTDPFNEGDLPAGAIIQSGSHVMIVGDDGYIYGTDKNELGFERLRPDQLYTEGFPGASSVLVIPARVNGEAAGHIAADVYWTKYAQMYDTGGYTGDWNSSEGRLAILHEKEIVLNKKDTPNLLQAVQLLRNMDLSNIIDKQVTSMLNQTSSNLSDLIKQVSLKDYTYPDSIIEQTVQINAEFPNATDQYEIQEALANLSNNASQYLGLNK